MRNQCVQIYVKLSVAFEKIVKLFTGHFCDFLNGLHNELPSDRKTM